MISTPRPAFYRALLRAAAVLFFLRAATSILWLGWAIPVRWDLSFPEGALVARAADVAEGHSPYHDWREWPHAFAPYGPLTYYSAGLTAKLSGSRPSIGSIYLSGRIISAVSILGILIVAGYLTFLMTGSLVWAAIGGLAPLMWENLFAYCISYRPDAPQVFFALLAVALALSGRPGRSRAIGVAICLSISFWFKAASWGIAVAVAVWLVRALGKRRGAALVFVALILNGMLALVLDRMSGGNFLLNTAGSLDNGLRFGNLAAVWRHTSWYSLGVLISAVVLSVRAIAARRDESSVRYLPVALLASLGVSMLEALKTGSDMNYLLEPYVLASVMTAAAMSRAFGFGRAESADAKAPMTRGLTIAMAVAVVIGISAWNALGLRLAIPDLKANRALWEERGVTQEMRKVRGPILAMTPYLALQQVNRTTVLDYYQYRVLVERGKLSPEQLRRHIQERRFSLIALEADAQSRPAQEYFLPEFSELLRESYEPTGRMGALAIYTPRR